MFKLVKAKYNSRRVKHEIATTWWSGWAIYNIFVTLWTLLQFYITSKFSKVSCKIAAKATDVHNGKLQDSEPRPVGLAVV